MYTKGDIIEFLPEFQDEGDDQFVWVALNDEEKGRVDVTPMGTGLSFPPIHTVKTSMLKKPTADENRGNDND